MTEDLGNKKIMAENIKKFLTVTGKTQKDMCHDLGFKETTVSDWINAKNYPRIDKIELMAKYFGVQKSDLVEAHPQKDLVPNYYTTKTSQIAQEIYDNPDLGVLFDTARGATPDDLKAVIEILKRMKK